MQTHTEFSAISNLGMHSTTTIDDRFCYKPSKKISDTVTTKYHTHLSFHDRSSITTIFVAPSDILRYFLRHFFVSNNLNIHSLNRVGCFLLGFKASSGGSVLCDDFWLREHNK